MGEMLMRKPMFPGVDEISQLEQIWKICGTPSEEDWPGISQLPWWAMLRPKQECPRVLKDNIKRYVSVKNAFSSWVRLTWFCAD
jgi:CTD kinase subunit alpha